MTGQTWRRGEEQTHELQLSFDELTLIYKSLQAAKALGALPPQDELLSDTMQLVAQPAASSPSSGWTLHRG
jgi:hypothetical protein